MSFERPPALRGMISRTSYADYQLELARPSIAHYIASLSCSRRNKVRRELKQGGGCVRRPLEGHEEIIARMRQTSALRHNSYVVIPADFYRIVSREMKDSARVILAGRDGDWRGAVSYFVSGDGLYVLHGGARDRDFTHFHLTFYEPIRIASEQGLTRINLRGGSREAKLSRGCREIPTTLFCKPVSARARALFALIGSLKVGKAAACSARSCNASSGCPSEP
jgi:predicted N-acyltransferase